MDRAHDDPRIRDRHSSWRQGRPVSRALCSRHGRQRGRLNQRLIHEWPDVVGEMIEPGPDVRAGTLPLIVPSYMADEEPSLKAFWLKEYRAGRIDPVTLDPIKPLGCEERVCMETASIQTCSYEEETRSLASAFSRSLRHLRTRQSVCSISRSIDAGRNGGRRLAISAVAATNVRATFNTADLLG